MKRLPKILGVGFAILLAAALAGGSHLAFRTPPFDPRPLPDGLISIESTAGQALLAESYFAADYERLTRRIFFGNPNIQRFHTNVVMDNVKVGLEIPF